MVVLAPVDTEPGCCTCGVQAINNQARQNNKINKRVRLRPLTKLAGNLNPGDKIVCWLIFRIVVPEHTLYAGHL